MGRRKRETIWMKRSIAGRAVYETSRTAGEFRARFGG